MNQALTFRLINSSDSIENLNSILRAAYAPLAAKGMRYAASHEDVESTRINISKGECHLGLLDSKIIGCVLLRKAGEASDPKWYARPDVLIFGRFAIHPDYQGKGFGIQFMDYIEDRARARGAKELALDTSEKADHLIKMYELRGYRFIEHHQWDITNYRSIVMSKTL